MFTGIIAAMGKVQSTKALEDGLRLTIDAGALDLSDVALGDSIACNGVCLTVVEVGANKFAVDVSRETLNCSAGLDGSASLNLTLNLEKALRLADRLGGHLVSGHVDGVGEVVKFERVGESHELVIRAPQALAKYIARKGSIAVNGVSLTTNTVNGAEFSINVIPHTIAVTTLQHLAAGSRVNLEVDQIARYVERMLAVSEDP
jgi:riboflavin synthase